MLTVIIDELTPCLKNADTGILEETEVIQLTRKSILQKYNKKSGWYTNWANLVDENNIYALVLKGTYDIQGMVAISNSQEYDSAFITWMCASPENNKLIINAPKYLGVGGHLFAIASQISLEMGYGGIISGYAANKKLMQHYCNVFGAEWIGILHKYQIAIDEIESAKIREVYDYDWTNEKI